jgi:hypothetical protein
MADKRPWAPSSEHDKALDFLKSNGTAWTFTAGVVFAGVVLFLVGHLDILFDKPPGGLLAFLVTCLIWGLIFGIPAYLCFRKKHRTGMEMVAGLFLVAAIFDLNVVAGTVAFVVFLMALAVLAGFKEALETANVSANPITASAPCAPNTPRPPETDHGSIDDPRKETCPKTDQRITALPVAPAIGGECRMVCLSGRQ